MSEVFDKAVKEGLASLGEAEPDLHPLPQSKLSISKKVPRSSELYEGISGVYPPERVTPPGYINPLDNVEHPDQIPEFIKSFRKKERTSQINPEGLTATEQMHRRFPSIDPLIGSTHLTDVEEGRTGIFPHPKGSFKEGFDLTDWQNSQLGIEFLKFLSHEGGKYPYEAGAKDPEGIQAIETFKGVMGPTGSLLLPSLTKAALKATDPTVMRMMVGEDAKLPKKVMEDLDRAKRLDRYGRDRNYIYDQTGWSRESNVRRPGSDENVGKWMFEISDRKAYIKPNIDYAKSNLVLEDVLHHPELFKVSPEFKKHPINIDQVKGMEGAGGSYAGAGTESGLVPGTISVRPFLDHTIRNRLEDMDMFLHPKYGKYGNKKNIDLVNKKEYPGRSAEGMKYLLESYGYKTRKEAQSISNKHIENIFQKELVRDYKKLKEAHPEYMTNIDWLINQRDAGAVPNINEFKNLLKMENKEELMKARGTRGIYEPDYVMIPDKRFKDNQMYRENANYELIQELSTWGGGARSYMYGGKPEIQSKIQSGERADRYRDRPSNAPGGDTPMANIRPGSKQEALLEEKYGFEWPYNPDRTRLTLRKEGVPRQEVLYQDQKSMHALDTALHEVQHGSQHRYDFTPGIHPRNPQIFGWPQKLKAIKRRLGTVDAKLKTKRQKGLFRTPGGLPTIRHDLQKHKFPNITDKTFSYPSSIIHKGKEYSLEGRNMDLHALLDDLPLEVKKALGPGYMDDLRKGSQLASDRKQFAKEIKKEEYKEHIPRSLMSKWEQYLHDRGEAWARNTARRKDLPAQTFPRKDKDIPRPWETLDVREDLLWDSKKWDKHYWPYPFMPKKKTGGGLSGLGEK